MHAMMRAACLTAAYVTMGDLMTGCAPHATDAQAQPAQSQPAQSQPAKNQSVKTAPTCRTATDELAVLDGRTPVPLQPMMAWHQKQNMMQHLVAIQEITTALAQKDWDTIQTAASSIGLSDGMAHTCERMGAGAAGFTARALEFHRRADAIAAAAARQDPAAVLKATGYTLQACTGCHATYRQDVVDARVWAERTGQETTTGAGMSPDAHGHH